MLYGLWPTAIRGRRSSRSSTLTSASESTRSSWPRLAGTSQLSSRPGPGHTPYRTLPSCCQNSTLSAVPASLYSCSRPAPIRWTTGRHGRAETSHLVLRRPSGDQDQPRDHDRRYGARSQHPFSNAPDACDVVPYSAVLPCTTRPPPGCARNAALTIAQAARLGVSTDAVRRRRLGQRV